MYCAVWKGNVWSYQDKLDANLFCRKMGENNCMTKSYQKLLEYL